MVGAREDVVILSLAMTLANQYGIVMSADRRLTATILESNESFVRTDYEQKLFLAPSGHGMVYTGDASLRDGVRTSCIIADALMLTAGTVPSVKDELSLVRSALSRSSDGHNVILIGAGIESGGNSVLSTNLISEEITVHDSGAFPLVHSGADKPLTLIAEAYPSSFSTFPIQETINYLKFMNRTVAGIQHYSQTPQTVSDDCDMLVIQKSGTRWVVSPHDWR